MLVSHKYKFIFVKTTKTAGTSIEADLEKIAGDDAIVTPIIPPLPGHKPRNYQRKVLGIPIGAKYRNHMRAEAMRPLLGEDVFNSYCKFCVEREPVDKCISHYSMLRNSPDHNNKTGGLTWDAYVEQGFFPVDTPIYTSDDGSLLVDRILKYETLGQDIQALGEELGFKLQGLKSKAKSGFREEIQPTEQQLQVIYDAFTSSNNLTGYAL